jgi:N-acetyl-gamma-glutamyl-phosphate reductase
MLSAGIIGGTGYTGKYLIEYCNNHPFIDEFKIYGNESAGENLLSVFPEFKSIVADQEIESAANVSFHHDVYFVALPHGKSIQIVPQLAAEGKLVIDLGGDFRLNDAASYLKWYGLDHPAGHLLSEKVYGLADCKNTVYDKPIIANPGCYPTAALLSLLPLVKNFSNFLNAVSIVAYSGTSGAGKSAKTNLLMSEMDGNVKAYNVNKHRHQPEIVEQLLNYNFEAQFSFTTHLLPVSKGIYSTASVHTSFPVDASMVHEAFQNEYSNSEFVRIRKEPPSLSWVVNTNYCDINIDVSGKTIIITAAIDNLIKGASGQAIQNMNNYFGWDESLGIKIQQQSFLNTGTGGAE